MPEQMTPEDLQARKAEVLKVCDLPETANAAEVVQRIVEKSAHYCALIDLMKIARLFDADLMIYVEERTPAEGV